ncbi:patatin-like phospholipase family protein [Paraflavitalea sp. CAU 1676]|uniref:patatin-like phospholipase family protein n=1 Tax=Paraflavitalea sp. CAU 1676 TaxID=3032598 RepID=UPI0023D9B6F9|nr:patatin-like phospholipase family protein [Paraflavitalea sp. CAU 1676]MDF2191177.1 patatin-like phospholipase family protein [Paraflavitalea sp. CAU 1676]
MAADKKLGLSLSGGGYRAAAFHMGTLRKLHEMGVLEKVDVMSTISGGSITGAYYCLHNKDFAAFDKYMTEALGSKNVIKQVFLSFTFIRTVLFFLLFLVPAVYVLFSAYAWLSLILIGLMLYLFVRFQFAIFPVSKEIERAYNKFFYEEATLSRLTEKPLLAIGSTNLQSARPFTFSRLKMEDSSYAFMDPAVRFKQEEFPVARAVMASSCVPFAFTPVHIDKQFYVNPADTLRVEPQLVDGGVYDNQGIHKITQRGSIYACDIVITSDAGNKLPFQGSYNNLLILLIRTMDVFMARIKNFQMTQDLYDNTELGNRQIAYLSLGWNLEQCIPGFIDNLAKGKITDEVIQAHQFKEEWVKDPQRYRTELTTYLENEVNYKEIFQRNLKPPQLTIARNVGTNLTPLSKEELTYLAIQAANLTELQVRLYCPTLTQPS